MSRSVNRDIQHQSNQLDDVPEYEKLSELRNDVNVAIVRGVKKSSIKSAFHKATVQINYEKKSYLIKEYGLSCKANKSKEFFDNFRLVNQE